MNNPEKEQDKQDAAEIKNYTRTPNMLIYGYRDISPQEKWLYVCLKHLCGKKGTRHLALRYISEQTGISVGALSKSKNKQGVVNEGMMRHLHDAGLIHAEIKKKDGAGNAQYHVTITDVWDLNQAFFIERKATRSDFGQDENETSEPVRIPDEPVQISDKAVRKSNKLVQNSDEPVRIPGQYQDSNKTNYKTDNKTTEQESDSRAESQSDDLALAIAAPPAPAVSQSETPQVETPTPSQDERVYTNSQLPDGSVYSAGASRENETRSQLSTGIVDKGARQSAKVEPQSKSRSKGKQASETPAPFVVPEMPPTDAEWKTTTCLLMFTHWRGKPLIGSYKNSQASTCAKGLATNYTREEVEWTRNHMVEEDSYWSQHPERVDVCKVAEHIHEILPLRNRAQKPKAKPTPILPSYHDLSDDEYYAKLRGGTR